MRMKTDTDKDALMLDIQAQYKNIKNALMAERDLETLFLVRILMETGIRSGDACDITPSNIHHRKVILGSKKQSVFYREYSGQYPSISKHTEQIGEALLRKQGKYFTRRREQYIMKIRRKLQDTHFNVHYFRHYHRYRQKCIFDAGR